MKFSDFKVGQLVGVQFPYSKDPQKKYGFKILEVDVNNARIVVRDVKTDEVRGFGWRDPFAKGPFAKHSERPLYTADLPHWRLIEDTPCS
jgi:hypothetical protein